jgi:hypothetical protein
VRIGLDLHGVSDAFPDFFAELSRLFIEAGHEVYVITGPPVNDRTIAEVERCGLKYTRILSIIDHHNEIGTSYRIDEKGHYWIGDEDWNRTKSILCERYAIDFHMDDSPHYGQYFKTPYMQVMSVVKPDKNERIKT